MSSCEWWSVVEAPRARGRGGWRGGRTSCTRPWPRRSARSRPTVARRRSCGRTIHGGRRAARPAANERRERRSRVARRAVALNDREEEIVAVAAGDQRSPLRRPHPFRDEKDADDGHKARWGRSRWPGDLVTERGEAGATATGSPNRPTIKGDGDGRDRAGGKVERAERDPPTAAGSPPGLRGPELPEHGAGSALITTEDMTVSGSWARSPLERRPSGTRVRLLRAAGAALALHRLTTVAHFPHLSLMFPFTWPGVLLLLTHQ